MALEPWEVKKREVIRQLDLLGATELTEICGMLSITVPLAKAGKQSDVYNLIMAHIISDPVSNSDDQGLALFTDMDTRLKQILSKKEVKMEDGKTVVTAEVLQSGGSAHGGLLNNANTNLGGTIPRSSNAAHGSGASDAGVRPKSNRFLKEFKVQGGFVASGDNPISYSNLKFQIEDGRDSGYNDREIMSGIIYAMKPNSKVRSYFVSAPRMEMDVFLRHVKSHYKLTDSSTLLTQLSGLVQGPNQKVQEFIDQLAQLRNDIITISEEEGNPLDPEMVKRRFRHVISVGLRKETIRVEIQALLKNENLTDVELGEQVQLIEAREEEHEKKMEESRKNKGASVNNMSADERSAESKAILDELSNIRATVNELSVSKSGEVNVLKNQMAQMENRLRDLGGGSWNSDFHGYMGHDGTTYYNDSSRGGYFGGDFVVNRGAGHGNRGGGQGSRGGSFYNRGGSFVSNRGGNFGGNGGHGSRRGNMNHGNFAHHRGGFHGSGSGSYNDGSYNNYYPNDSYGEWNSYDSGYENTYNDGYAAAGYSGGFDSRGGASSGNRGAFGGNRGGFSGSRGVSGGSRGSGNDRGRSRGSGHFGGNRGGNRGGRGGHHGGTKKFLYKCEECQKTDAHCNHCTYCGESDHKWINCTKNH